MIKRPKKSSTETSGISTSEESESSGPLLAQFPAYLPYYLTSADKAALYRELKKFPDNPNIYSTQIEPDYAMQGDAWTSLKIRSFNDGALKSVSGVILSNSCDISSENQSHPDQNVVFAPRISLSLYQHALSASGRSQGQIDNILGSIRSQQNSRIFFLPRYGEQKDSIILFDDLHSQPLIDFLEADNRRIFSLNNYGWYLFLVKLSIHFTRVQENIQRG